MRPRSPVFRAQNRSPLPHRGQLIAQVRRVHHLLYVAQAFRPVSIIVPGDRAATFAPCAQLHRQLPQPISTSAGIAASLLVFSRTLLAAVVTGSWLPS